MANHTEWARASTRPEPVSDDFEDAHGQRVDAGNIGIWLEETLIEGTPGEFRMLIQRLTTLVDKVDPAGRYITHPTPTTLRQIEPITSWPHVTYHGWTDGYAVGFRAEHEDGRREYVYLNPSADDGGDSDGQPNVFLYHDASGDPSESQTVCYVDLFRGDVEQPTSDADVQREIRKD